MVKRNERRKKGEGSIFFREDKGLWCAKVDVGLKTKTIYAKDQQQLLEKKRNLEASVTTGTYIEPSKTTLKQFLSTWLSNVCEPSLSPHTIRRYKSIIANHVVPELGDVPLNKLTPIQVQGLYGLKLKQGQSPRSVQQLHAILHKALSQALKWEYINRNVADMVTAPKPRKKEMLVLDKQQVKRFLKSAEQDWYYALYVLALTTGLRQGELLGLKWEDLNLKSKNLMVKRSLKDINGELLIGEVKSNYSRRTVSLPKIAIDVLEKHQKIQEENDFSAIWVFTDTKGGLVRPQNMLRRSFKPLLIESGLPEEIRFHDLRHTHATLLLMKGVNPKLVQERLGHSSVSITLDIYSHVLPNMQRQVAKELDKIF